MQKGRLGVALFVFADRILKFVSYADVEQIVGFACGGDSIGGVGIVTQTPPAGI